ncbi:MAG: hypothetical protein U9Q78_02445 [Chloroflexota bacterium]|nr:hypothetical protein [Chloroflexota bacterium]
MDREAGLTAEMYRAVVAVVDERVEEIRVTRRDFDELRSVVQDMSQIQADTQASIRELAQAQSRTEARVGGLEQAMQELAQAQARTEVRLEELAQAQARTEERVGGLEQAMRDLAKAQARTETALQNLAQQVGALSENVGFGLEDIARTILPGYLRWKYGVKVKRLGKRYYRVEGESLEVDLYAAGQRNGQSITVLGEVKSRIYEREVEGFQETLAQVRSQIEGEIFPLMFGYFIHPSGVQAAGDEMVLIASYQPVTEFQAAEMEQRERGLDG